MGTDIRRYTWPAGARWRRVLATCALLVGCARTVQAQEDDLLYVLQPENVSLADLAASGFHWLVLEPSRDGSAAAEFTAAEIDLIRTQGPCRKTILAYLSIGEAEDYRDYWDPAWVDANGDPIPGVAPPWLGPQNPDWPGNYKVRYWMSGWQALLFGTPAGPDATPLDRIIDAGYDGVYLDIVDAYEFWSDPNQGIPELTRMAARRRMIDLIEAIATYARQTRGRPDFLVFPQNAADIIRDDNYDLDADTDRYFAAISGIGQEDLYYNELTAQPAGETQYVLEQLREFVARGKTVLVTDYCIDANQPTPAANNARVQDFTSRARAEGFVPYAAYSDRALDRVVTLDPADGWQVAQPTDGCPGCVADLDGNGIVDVQDLSTLLANFGLAGASGDQGDLDHDHDVDLTDLTILLEVFGASCP